MLPSFVRRRPSSVACCRPSNVVGRRPFVIRGPSVVPRPRSSVVRRPSSSVVRCRLSSVVQCLGKRDSTASDKEPVGGNSNFAKSRPNDVKLTSTWQTRAVPLTRAKSPLHTVVYFAMKQRQTEGRV